MAVDGSTSRCRLGSDPTADSGVSGSDLVGDDNGLIIVFTTTESNDGASAVRRGLGQAVRSALVAKVEVAAPVLRERMKSFLHQMDDVLNARPTRSVE